MRNRVFIYYYYYYYLFLGEAELCPGGGGGGVARGRHRRFSPVTFIYCAQSKVKWGANGGGGHMVLMVSSKGYSTCPMIKKGVCSTGVVKHYGF